MYIQSLKCIGIAVRFLWCFWNFSLISTTTYVYLGVGTDIVLCQLKCIDVTLATVKRQASGDNRQRTTRDGSRTSVTSVSVEHLDWLSVSRLRLVRLDNS